MDSRRDFTSKKVFSGYFSELGEKANSALNQRYENLDRRPATTSSNGSLSMLVGLLTRLLTRLLTLRGFPNSSNLVFFVCL